MVKVTSLQYHEQACGIGILMRARCCQQVSDAHAPQVELLARRPTKSGAEDAEARAAQLASAASTRRKQKGGGGGKLQAGATLSKLLLSAIDWTAASHMTAKSAC